jgi:hypothetical protein
VRTTRDFDTYFNIGRSRLLLIKLTPGLRLAEASDIRPRVGTALFDELKAKLRSSEEVDTALIDKIKEACVYKALAWGMGRLSAQLFPEGVLQYVGSNGLSTQGLMPTLKSEPEAHAQKFEQDARRVLQEIEAMIATARQVLTEPPAPIAPDFSCDDNFIST